MNFSDFKSSHKKWRNILVIGKTIERDKGNYHILGMTLSNDDEAKLYILEPYIEPGLKNRKEDDRQLLKEPERIKYSYLHCSSLSLGNKKMQVEDGKACPLKGCPDGSETVQLFSYMMDAGWAVPKWLEKTDWDSLQLVALNIKNLKKLPSYSPEMPITMTHMAASIPHALEKDIILTVGETPSFSFLDDYGDNVSCHINSIALIDVWKGTEDDLNDSVLSGKYSPEQLEEIKKRRYDALEPCCPKGILYIGIEYECSKNYSLVFRSKQYLSPRPTASPGSFHFLPLRITMDKELGTHGLPLKGCVVNTPVPPDTSQIHAKLLVYFEKVDEWTETVS